jgi:cellobiose phosphorylase
LGDISIADTSAVFTETTPFHLADETAFQTETLSKPNSVTIKALPNGCIYSIEHGNILINQILASPLAGGIHRIFLRIFDKGVISSTEITGAGATGQFSTASDQFLWNGSWRGLIYCCRCWLPLDANAWVFQVKIENRTGKTVNCDAILIQDVALATRAQVRNNERYTSQYLDHFAISHAELGHLVMTRQNLPQEEGKHPWLIQGCFPRAAGFCTSGFDFFGVGYKSNGVARGLSSSVIGQSVLQDEAGYIAIQSNSSEVMPGASHTWSFFSRFLADHPEPSSAADVDEPALRNLRQACEKMANAGGNSPISAGPKQPRSLFQTATLFAAKDFDESDIHKHFPGDFRHEEFDGPRRLSFFVGDDSRHVVLKSKELAIARPHGHIMRSGPGLMPDAEVMSCTCYAAGVFASQLALGNTVFGKFLSTARDPLNIVRSSGLRIFVRSSSSDAWELLGVPSAFEMATDFCRWYYKGNRDLLTVSCSASDEDAAFVFEVRTDQYPVELLICGEISAGPQEYESSPRLLIDARLARITIRPDQNSLLAQSQPNIVLHAVTATPHAIETIGGDELIGSMNKSPSLPYFAIRSHPTTRLSLSFLGVFGVFDGNARAESLCAKYEAFNTEPLFNAAGSSAFWKDVTGKIRISSASSAKAAQLQDALVWMARDAIIHFSVPRGLEQANGGAWGTRDVCQGPVEFLLSHDRADIVKTIIQELFSQQYRLRGDWPQWFMFPPFQRIQSPACHGDIVIWPLKALCDYLEHTNDGEILHQRLPYTDDETFERGRESETILEHVDQLLQSMRQQFLPGLAMPRFGGGDWDDSLQPKCENLAQQMVSSWTVALIYQTLRRYALALGRFGAEERANAVANLADQMQADFQRYLMPDGVVAGFAVFGSAPGSVDHYMLHPSDTRTGLRYRLISMTRGILSGIFSTEQAQEHLDLVRKYLLFPDGARLMDRPTKYHGGRESVFRRSESASFFGREIGLQYVHAHLRYAETLSAMGHSQELLHALSVVNPIAVTDVVKNAMPRQRNCYFSSSDARFRDRYEASSNYDKLRDGKVPVDGGWRIYSSGPGIYTNLVIRHLFGVRHYFDCMEFDPVLPAEFNGICCDLPHNGKKVRYQFRQTGDSASIKRISINGVEISSFTRATRHYRPGGIRIKKTEFEAALALPENIVEIDS